MVPNKLIFYSTLGATLTVLLSVVLALTNVLPSSLLYSNALLANVSGFLAVGLIVASGAMVFFKRAFLLRFRTHEVFKGVHIWLAFAGGVFLFIHVELLILWPISLPVFYGYIATYVAFLLWLSGLLFMEGLRGSMFYHSLLTLIGVALILIHTFQAGRDIPMTISGVVLVAAALVVIGGALTQMGWVRKASRRDAASAP
jgi:hypothetical protein